MARQRIRVSGADARIVGGIAVVAGIVAAFAGARPTGTPWLDVVMVVVFGAGVVWAAASAPWWAGVSAAAVATAFAPNVPLVVIGAVAVIGGMAIGIARRTLPWSRALVAAVALQVFARLGNVERFGFTSLLAIVTLLALAVFGVMRRPRRERRIMWLTMAGLGVASFVAVAGFGIAAASARPDLEQGADAARDGINLLADGQLDAAKVKFERAAMLLARADDELGAVWAQPSRLLPVVAQHRRSATSLVTGAEAMSSTIAEVLGVVDYDALRVVNGKIDIAAIVALQQPLLRLDASLASLEDAVSASSSPWLVGALKTRLAELTLDIDAQEVKSANAIAAVQEAPAMLGGDGKRVYFVAFTTPAEARGLGGFMGNWAEITLDHGKISVTDFGRTDDLNEAGKVGSKTLQMSDEFVNGYGDFLLADSERQVVGPKAWSNITASPDFPDVAQVIAQLYPQSGGKHLDGVFAMDVYTVAKLMEITGSITLSNGFEITPANAADYLLREQYLNPDNTERIDLLEEVARTTVTRLLTSTLPAPPELADLLGPMAREGRLMGWSAVELEQDVLSRVKMSGALPARGGGDGLTFAFNNAVGNKIDNYLDASAAYTVSTDTSAGFVGSVLDLKLTNSAPSTGMPDIVIANGLGLPAGTNRTFLSVYTALPFVTATLDGEPFPLEVSSDGEYRVASAFIELAPGETRMLQMQLAGGLDLSAGYHLVTRAPAGVRPIPITVTVDGLSLEENQAVGDQAGGS